MSRTISLILLAFTVVAAMVAWALLEPTSPAPTPATADPTPEPAPTPEPPAPPVAQDAEAAPTLDIAAQRLHEPPVAPNLDRTDVLVRRAVERSLERLRANPDAAWAWDELARTYHANQFIPEADVCYQQALLRDPTRDHAAYLLSMVYYQRGDVSHAVELADHAASLAPYAPALWRPGLWLLDEGDPDRAADYFKRALDIAPDDEAPLFGMARVAIMKGHVDDAIRMLEAIDTTTNAAYRNQLLGEAYRRAGKPDQAAEVVAAGVRGMPVWRDPWLQEIDDLRTGYVGEMTKASRFIDRQMYHEAIATLDELRALYPDEEALLINRAIANSGLGDQEAAMADLKSILDFKPDSYLAHQNIGAMLINEAAAAHASPDEAFSHLDRALEINPRDARSQALKGDYYMALRDPDHAIAAFEAALEIDPRYIDAIEKIGNICTYQKRFDDALAQYQRIVEIDPKADRIWLRIAGLRILRNEPDLAQQALDEARRRIPDTNRQIQQIQFRINQLRSPGDG